MFYLVIILKNFQKEAISEFGFAIYEQFGTIIFSICKGV